MQSLNDEDMFSSVPIDCNIETVTLIHRTTCVIPITFDEPINPLMTPGSVEGAIHIRIMLKIVLEVIRME